ncbi:MAG: hypothetical protein V8R63_00795 [Thomasclavelia ramosa]
MEIRNIKRWKVDFYTFSYYMSNCVKLTADATKEQVKVIYYGCKNPYLEASDWGWQIDLKD